jgi:queuine tRNA-ribosyltransferase
MPITFDIHATDGAARAGTLTTPHGTIPTPAFVPVATQASVKTVTPQELRGLGAAVLLGNAYHLYLRPGVDLVRDMGGLAAFMGWGGPTITDSGGFQAYSLAARVNIGDDGLRFRSHIDGSSHTFTPQSAISHQEALGADIIMALDQCLEYTEDKDAVRNAMDRTHRWAALCQEAQRRNDQALFGIVQGGVFPDLREQSAAFITGLDFPGYAIGGMEVGEPKAVMYPLVGQTAALLPPDRPRHLLGIGSPEDLVECVGLGIDLFDCALPTRVARNGALYTRSGRINIDAARYRGVDSPVEDGCDCDTCRHFTVGYLHHLFRAGELLALRLATVHNLRFIARLMGEMRLVIQDGNLETYAREFLASYRPANEDDRREQRQRWSEARRGRSRYFSQ